MATQQGWTSDSRRSNVSATKLAYPAQSQQSLQSEQSGRPSSSRAHGYIQFRKPRNNANSNTLDYEIVNASLLFPRRLWATAPGTEAQPEVSSARNHRRIVLCFDGTGNKFGEKNSNVLQFFKCLQKDDETQLVYYQTGIGTYTHPWLATKLMIHLTMTLDAAIAWNLEHHVEDAYRFLMQMYQPGDKICLFGFSRGAYTARVLAGFIQKIGLLPIENIAQIPFAWDVFKASDSDEGHSKCVDYKDSFSRGVKIDFVGLWDTVYSVGISGRELPFARPMKDGGIRVFRHALALDERRAKFKPNFKQAVTKNAGTVNVSSNKPSHSEGEGREVWFAGCHSDVGGGCVENGTRNSLACISLRWMIRECFRERTGIKFDKVKLIDIGFDAKAIDSGIGAQSSSAEGRGYFRPPPGPIRGGTEDRNKFIRLIRSFFKGLWAVLLFLLRCAWTIGRWLLVCFSIRHLYHVIKYTSFYRRFIEEPFSSWCHDQPLESEEQGQYEAEAVEVVNEDKEELYDAGSPLKDLLYEVWLWWLFELWPLVVRRQNSKDRCRELQTQVNLGRGREIYGDAWNADASGGEYIEVHRSVLTRMKECPGYRPNAWFIFGEGEKFHWGTNIDKSTRIGDLRNLGGGWSKIRWVGDEEEEKSPAVDRDAARG